LATIQRKHKRQFPSIEYPRYSVGSHPQLHRGPVSAIGSLKNSTLRYLPHHKSTSASDSPIYLRLHSFHASHFSTTMCAVAVFKSATCPHKWLTITQSCGPGIGTRHTFTGRTNICGGPRYIPAPTHPCPTCNKKDQYDGNKIRMVLRDQTPLGIGYWCGGAGREEGYEGGYRGRTAAPVCAV
jgi:hypothetical protein